MKLTLRFLLLVAALLAAVAASAISGNAALQRLDQALDGVVKNDVERLLAITHSRRLFRSMVVLERDYMLSTSAEERKGMDKKMTKASVELLEQIDKYEKLMPAEDKKTLVDIRGARDRWLERDEKVRTAARNSDPNAVKLAALHSKDPVSWETAIGGLVKKSEARLAAQVKATHETYLTAKRRLFGVSALAAIIAAALGTAIFLGIRRNMREITELNTNLEGIVKVRTEALAARERSLRLVLDSTGDGIIGVKHDGTVAGGSSAAAERWFGVAKSATPLPKYLFPDDEDAELNFEVAFDQLRDGLLPWSLLVDQMPRRLERSGLVLELDFMQVTAEGSELSLLVLARDVTARVKSEEAEQEAREQQSLVAKLLADKQGFATFVSDTERLIQSLEGDADLTGVRRNLHTLKGNVAIYGLSSLAQRCHALEDKLEASEEAPSAADIAELGALFRKKLQGIEDFLIGVNKDVYEVGSGEHDALIESLLARRDYQDILKMVEQWTWRRTSEHLGRLRSQLEYVAKKLDKQVEVSVEHNDLRLPATYLEQFWPTLAHVTRNAIDHGVEEQGKREEQGKPPRAAISLRTWQDNDSFHLEISDDGAGIDVDAVVRAATARGLEVAPNSDPVMLIFADGVSTREEVTELSGRGVGLSATKDACEAAGGRLEVKTELGKGTTFSFRFRRPFVKPGALAEKVTKRWSLMPAPAGDESTTLPKAAPRRAS